MMRGGIWGGGSWAGTSGMTLSAQSGQALGVRLAVVPLRSRTLTARERVRKSASFLLIMAIGLGAAWMIAVFPWPFFFAMLCWLTPASLVRAIVLTFFLRFRL